MKHLSRNGEVIEHSVYEDSDLDDEIIPGDGALLWPLVIVSVVMGLAVGTGVVFGIVKVANYWMK